MSQARRGTQTRTFQDDAAIDHGRQVIRIGSIHAQVIQIGRRAYVSGNGAAMVGFFGFPKAQRSRLAHHSVVLTPADPGYQAAVTEVTIGSTIHDLLPTGPLSRKATTLNGHPVIAITGSPPAGERPPAAARETLFLSQGQHPLPLRETATIPGGVSSTTTLSRWGKPVTVSAPRHPIPLSALRPSDTT